MLLLGVAMLVHLHLTPADDGISTRMHLHLSPPMRVGLPPLVAVSTTHAKVAVPTASAVTAALVSLVELKLKL